MSEPAIATNGNATWHRTACILCSLNCGLEVQIGGPAGRHLTRIKGDKDRPISQGYL
jgi:anaerobic selenocysteine-containing dehydrogenase